MTLQAGFAEVDISPRVFPARTYWATVDQIIDPQFAHAAVFRDGAGVMAFLSLDVVIIEREYVAQIRERISRACAIPADAIMVCATHNHACGAVVERPRSPKDHAYIADLIERGAQAVLAAYRALAPVEVGTGTGYEGRVSFNRRFIRKNGTVISQPSREMVERDVLFPEAVIDPGLGVLAVRDQSSKIIGMLVNFACHAVHLMGSLSAGFPGVLCRLLKETYGPDFVCVFLNGACGNVIHRNFADPQQQDTKEHIGTVLADDVKRIASGLSYTGHAPLAHASASVALRYREIAGLAQNLNNLRAYNVFDGLIERGWYAWSLARLQEMHARSDHEDAELQVLRVGDVFFGAVPAEYFCQHALRIKEESPAARTFVVSLANGWLGYIPHRAAFDRVGGHESTWCISSKMAPEAGDQMADAVLGLIRRLSA